MVTVIQTVDTVNFLSIGIKTQPLQLQSVHQSSSGNEVDYEKGLFTLQYNQSFIQ